MRLRGASRNPHRRLLAAMLALAACTLAAACTAPSNAPTSPSGAAVASVAVNTDGLKGVICHATGSDSNPFVGVVVGIGPNVDSPVFSNNGHLDANGSPLSGHEQDVYIGPSPPNEKSDCNKLPPPPK